MCVAAAWWWLTHPFGPEVRRMADGSRMVRHRDRDEIIG